MKKAAFFDIDKTLYPGILAVDFVNQIKLNPEASQIIEGLSLSEDAGVVNILKVLQSSGRMTYALYLSLIKKTFLEVKDKFNEEALGAFKYFREQGFCMVALSQAPFMLLKLYAQNIDGDSFDVVASPMPTFIESDGNLVLGPNSVVSTNQRDKAGWVKHLAECYGFDLSLSCAIGDSKNDIPMLEAVGGRKIAFNPDSELKLKAESEGWEIIEAFKFNKEEK